MSTNADQILPLAPSEPARELTPGRRLFLKGILGAGALLAFDGWKAIDEDANSPNPHHRPTPGPLGNEVSPAEEPVRAVNEELEKPHTLASTTVDTLEVTGANLVYGVLTNNKLARLWSGNSGTEEIIKKYRENRLQMAALLVAGAPVAEELIFRAAPGIASKKRSLMPVRGIISTYLFGKMHQIKADQTSLTGEASGGIDRNRVPVPQYVLGAYLWMVARRRGVKHAVLAHAINNSVALAGLEAVSHSKKYAPNPENKDELVEGDGFSPLH